MSEAERINRPEFIGEDPVQFPRRFSSLQDIEITALLVASISWGKRTMILRDAERMLRLMDYQPYRFMMERGYEALDPALNVHRTFFARHLQWYLRGLREIYRKHESLDSFAASIGAGSHEAPGMDSCREYGAHHTRHQQRGDMRAMPSDKPAHHCAQTCEHGSEMACQR